LPEVALDEEVDPALRLGRTRAPLVQALRWLLKKAGIYDAVFST
jgi:hypothetical protein